MRNGTQKGGRPRLPENEKCNKPLHFKVTEDEYNKFIDKVNKSGKSQSEVLRQMLSKVQIRPRMSNMDWQNRRDLQGACNNLNQLAHQANIAGYGEEIKEQHMSLMTDISTLLKGELKP